MFIIGAWQIIFLQEGKVLPYKKSEPVPAENNEPVKVVVADSLQDIVFNSGKNGVYPVIHYFIISYRLPFLVAYDDKLQKFLVFVFFYVTWCNVFEKMN